MRRVVVTLPAYNEEKTIGSVLAGVFAVAASLPDMAWQVVVVDDCSIDGTAAIAEQGGARVIRLAQKAGLAEVFRQEMQTALELNADWIVHLDSDGQHPPDAILRLLDQLEQGFELVVGSRFLNHRPAGKPQIEQFESRAFSRLLSWITGHPFTDAHSGFRAFTRRVARDIPIRSNFSYAREQLFRAACRGIRLTDVPISAAARKQGQSRLIKNRYRTLLAVTWRYCLWTAQERQSLIKIPVILIWGTGAVALSWLFRTLRAWGIRPPLPRLLTPKP